MSRYQVHDSMVLSGVALLDNEVMSFLKEVDALERMHVGTAEDCPELREAMKRKEGILSELDQTIRHRLSTVQPSSPEEQVVMDRSNRRFTNGNAAYQELLGRVQQVDALAGAAQQQLPVPQPVPPRPTSTPSATGLAPAAVPPRPTSQPGAYGTPEPVPPRPAAPASAAVPPRPSSQPGQYGVPEPLPPRPAPSAAADAAPPQEVAYDQLYPARAAMEKQSYGGQREVGRLSGAGAGGSMGAGPSGMAGGGETDGWGAGEGSSTDGWGETTEMVVSGVPVQVRGDAQDLFGDLELDGKKLEYRGSVYFDTTELERRNEEMAELAGEMVALKEVFQDAATEIDQQTEDLEIAEEAADDAQVNTKQAVNSLGKSSKNAKKVVLPAGGALTGAVAGGITGLVAFGPVGGVVGAGIGAAGGALAGHGTGLVLRANTNKTMEKARLSEKWQPDKSAKSCTACGRQFTTTFRKHHCRSCGSIFCRKCTTHKSYLPGIEDSRKVLVCDACYNRINYGREESTLSAVPVRPTSKAPSEPLQYPDSSPSRSPSLSQRPMSAAPPSSSPTGEYGTPPPVARHSHAPPPGGAPPPISRASKPPGY